MAEFTSGIQTGAIDVLTGQPAGNNLYFLSLPIDDVYSVFYSDGDPTTPGINDYALITNFVFSPDPNVTDRIVLAGDPSNYSLGASPDGLPSGTGVFFSQDQAVPELIGIVENVSPSQLNLSDPNQFTFLV